MSLPSLYAFQTVFNIFCHAKYICIYHLDVHVIGI